MSKPEIKVTEKMYDTLVHPIITEKAMKCSETKRFRGTVGTRSDYKKAIVTLAEGSNIDFTTGV